MMCMWILYTYMWKAMNDMQIECTEDHQNQFKRVINSLGQKKSNAYSYRADLYVPNCKIQFTKIFQVEYYLEF